MTSFEQPIVHIYYSDLAHESRLLRAARAAVDAGLAPHATGIGYLAPGLATEQEMAPGVHFRRLALPSWLRSGGKAARLLRWPFWAWIAAREAAAQRPSVIQCHSLAAMPAGLLAKWRSPGSRIVYDAHELETERNGWTPLLRRIARVIERRMIRHSDILIVVGPMIAQWYGERYGIPLPTIVRNVPDLKSARPSATTVRQHLGLDADAILFIYVGVIGSGRGVPALLQAFGEAPSNRHVAFIGYGPLTAEVQAAARQHVNIHYVPPVPSEEITSFISNADVGLSIIEDTSLSYRYCLPNKIFEYRHAGLGVLASDLPEMRALLEEYGGGWLVEENAKAISAVIASISRNEVRAMESKAKPLFGWTEERGTYLGVMNKLLADRSARPVHQKTGRPPS